MDLDALSIKTHVHEGTTYLSKEYKHEDRTMVIKVKQYENDPNFVYSGLYRDEVSGNLLKISEISLSSDFFTEMDFLFNFMEGKDAYDKMSYLYAFDAIVEDHINKYGRLIDTDLEGYLDNALRLLFHFYRSLNPYLVPDLTEGREVRSNFRRLIMEKYFEYIWVNVHDPLNPMNTSLVKLSAR